MDADTIISRPAADIHIRRQRPINWGKISLWLFCSFVFVYLVFPLLIVIPMSFSSVSFLVFPPPGWSLQWYERIITSPFWVDGIVLSLKISVLTMILATMLGTMAALALVRGRFRGKGALNILILAPLIVPAIVVAAAIYRFYLGIGLVGSISGFVLIYTAMTLPVVVLVIAAALVDFDESLEKAAMSLGANRLRTYLSITFPLIRPAIGVAALFAFKGAFDEVVIAIFISGSPPTLPAHMFYSVEQAGDLTIAAISSITITIITLVFVTSAISQWARERKKAV